MFQHDLSFILEVLRFVSAQLPFLDVVLVGVAVRNILYFKVRITGRVLDFLRSGNKRLALLFKRRPQHDEDDYQRHAQQGDLEPARFSIGAAWGDASKNSGQ
jgi:hypothetical protein